MQIIIYIFFAFMIYTKLRDFLNNVDERAEKPDKIQELKNRKKDLEDKITKNIKDGNLNTAQNKLDKLKEINNQIEEEKAGVFDMAKSFVHGFFNH